MRKLRWRVLAAMTSLAVLGVGSSGCTTSDQRDAASESGTIKIEVAGAEGLEGYRILAGVWDGSDIVGGAFWTIVDRDPFTASDVVHPPNWSDHPSGDNEDGWGAGDYVWDDTAALEPGTYRIEFWANPGELAPYGSMIPAGPIERSCVVPADVKAGETTTVMIWDIPIGGEGDSCGSGQRNDAENSESAEGAPLGTVTLEFANLEDEAGTELAGVLLTDTAFGGTAVGGFAVNIDTDPFSGTVVLGIVDEAVGPYDGGLWPWPTGVIQIPAGTYTLRLALGTDYCCYSRWMPAETAGLRLCDVTVVTTGEDRTVEITEIPKRGRCGTTDTPAISEECLADMENAASVPNLEADFKNEELWPTFTSCTSVEEWEAARITAGIESPFDVGHIEPECGFNPAVAGTPLCEAWPASRN